jgi:hypothetical protein
VVRSCPVCEQRELLLWYAAGAISEEDRKLVDEALSSCPRCREALELDRALAVSARRARAAGLSPEELVRLASSPTSDLSELSSSDREIVSILRAVDAEQAQRETMGFRGGRRIWENLRDSLGLGAWAARPVWAYLLLLAMAYPAYRGLFSRGAQGPTILTEPVVLGEPSRTGNGSEVGMARAGSDTVLTLFVPVDPSYRYRLSIENESGAIVFHDDDARPFDAAGTFAVLLPARSFPPGRYEIQLEETSPTGSVSNRYRFFFELESDGGGPRGRK